MTSPITNPLTDPRVLMSREDIALRRLRGVAESLILTGSTGGGGGSSGTLVITGGSASSTFSGGDSVISGGSA